MVYLQPGTDLIKLARESRPSQYWQRGGEHLRAPPSPCVGAPFSETLKKLRKCAATVAARAQLGCPAPSRQSACPLSAGQAACRWVPGPEAEVSLPRSCRFAGGQGQPAGRVSGWLPQLLAKGADDAATPGRRASGGGSGRSQEGHPAAGAPLGGTSRWRRRGLGRHGCDGRWPLGIVQS